MTDAVVGRVVVEIGAGADARGGGEDAQPFSWLDAAWVARLLEDCLADLTEAMGPEAMGPDAIGSVQIDRLEADLGGFPADADPAEIYRRARETVSEQLRQLLSNGAGRAAFAAGSPMADRGEGQGPVAAGPAALEALRTFLRFGVRDWTAPAGMRTDDLIAMAAAAAPAETAALLRAAVRDPAIARRLGDHLTAAGLEEALSAMASAGGGLLLAAEALFRRLHAASPLASLAPAAMAAALRSAALTAAAETGGAARPARDWVQAYTAAAGLMLGRRPEALLRAAAARLSRREGGAAGELEGQTEASVAREIERLAAAVPEAQREAPGGIAPAAMQALAAYLRTGALDGTFRDADGAPMGEGVLRQALRAGLAGGAAGAALRTAVAGTLTGAGERGAAAASARLRQLLPPREAARAAAMLGLPPSAAGEEAPAASPPRLTGPHPESASGSVPGGAQETEAAAVLRGDGDPEDGGSGDSDPALFWFLMEYGALPWWGRGLALQSLDAWVARLVAERAPDLAAALRGMPEHRRALLIERMAARLSSGPLAGIASAARPDLEASIRAWLTLAPAIAAAARPMAGGGLEAPAGAGTDAAPMAPASPASPATVPAGEQPAAAALAPPSISTDWALHALAAVLLARLFDPHAPRADWEALAAALRETVARRLRLPRQAVDEAYRRAVADGSREAPPPPASPPDGGEARPGLGEPPALSGLPAGAQEQAPGSLGSAGMPASVAASAAEPPDDAVAPDTAAADLALVERFLSPALQLSVPVEELAALLSDGPRRRALAGSLTAAQLDALAASLAPGSHDLRADKLESLAPAVAAALPAMTPAHWTRDVKERLADMLASAVRGGAAGSAETALEALLRQQAIRSGRPFREHLAAVLAAAAGPQAAVPEALALLRRIMERQAAGADTGADEDSVITGENAAADASRGVAPAPDRPDAADGRPTPDSEVPDVSAGAGAGRVGLPESERPDEQALLAAFLAATPGSAEGEARLARLRQVLADPLRREGLAARSRLSDLDLLARRMGLEGRGIAPSAVPALARLAAAVLPGAGSPRWMQAALADLLGGMAAGAASAPGVPAQLRDWLIRLAREEGRDYPGLVAALAAAAEQQPGALPAALRGALRTLAATAVADAPAEPLPPPSLRPDSLSEGPAASPAAGHASSTGSMTPGSGSAAPAPDSQPPNAVERPAASPPAREPSRQAEPAGASRGQDGGTALLTGFLAAAPGTAESRRLTERMQALLADPQQRQALAARSPPAQLDQLAARLGLAGKVFPPSAVPALARLAGAVLPGGIGSRWAEAALADVLGAMAGGAEHAPGAAGQLRLWLIRLARDGGRDYAGFTAALATQAERAASLPPGIRQALRTLAAAAEDTLPADPDGMAGTDSPARSDGEMARQRPAREADRRTEGSGGDEGSAQEGTQSAHEQTRSLLVRYLAGEGNVRQRLLDRLASPAERLPLARVLSLAELDRLAARMFGDGGFRPAEMIALAPFLAGLLPSIPAEAWRALVAQRLLAAAAATTGMAEAPGVQERGGGVPAMERLLDGVLATAASAAGMTAASLAAGLQLAARQAGVSLPPAVAAALARRVPASPGLGGEGDAAGPAARALVGEAADPDTAGSSRAPATAERAEPGAPAASPEEVEALTQFLAAEQAAPGYRSLAAAAWLALRRWTSARIVPLPLSAEAVRQASERLAEAGFPPQYADWLALKADAPEAGQPETPTPDSPVSDPSIQPPSMPGPSARSLPEGGTGGDAAPAAGGPDARDPADITLPAVASAVLDPGTAPALRSRLAYALADLLEEDEGSDPDRPPITPGDAWLRGMGAEELHRLRAAVEQGLPLPEVQPQAVLQPLAAIIAGSVPEAGNAEAERALAAAMLRRSAAQVREIARLEGEGATSALPGSRLADAALAALHELAARHGRPLAGILADAARLAGQQPALQAPRETARQTEPPNEPPRRQQAASGYPAGHLAEIRETLEALATGPTDGSAAARQEPAASPSTEPPSEAVKPPESHPASAGEQSAESSPGEPSATAPAETAEPAPAAEGWPWRRDDEDSAAMPRDLIFVDDAGVVLLWPFLTHYFDRVGLLEGGRFASDEAAARGVMLIHYMAAAGTETEEPRLVLPKLLCGVPFTVPVSPRIEPTDIEQTVSEELLNVVCQNWPPLRNSSVEALRETFLLREGSLSWLEEQIWLLKVSAKPFDMLLGQLPWTISTFKTPLMEYPVMVQWGDQ